MLLEFIHFINKHTFTTTNTNFITKHTFYQNQHRYINQNQHRYINGCLFVLFFW